MRISQKSLIYAILFKRLGKLGLNSANGSDITNGGNGVEHNRQPLDSMDLYNIQIDKSTILTNLIRNNNGRYYLDLTEQDAEILGIKSELYYNALRNVEQMNNNK